jgi:hypothetical protein
MLGDRYSLVFAIKCLGGLGIVFVLINSIILVLGSKKSK